MTVYCLLFAVYCSRFTVCGLRFTVYGLRFTVCGLRLAVYGLRLKFTVYGLRSTVYGLRLAATNLRLTVGGIRFTVYGLRLTAYGLRNTDNGHTLRLHRGQFVFTYVYQELTGIHRDNTGILIYYFFVYRRILHRLSTRQPPPRPCLYTGIHKLSTGNPQATNVGMVIAQDSTGIERVYTV